MLQLGGGHCDRGSGCESSKPVHTDAQALRGRQVQEAVRQQPQAHVAQLLPTQGLLLLPRQHAPADEAVSRRTCGRRHLREPGWLQHRLPRGAGPGGGHGCLGLRMQRLKPVLLHLVHALADGAVCSSQSLLLHQKQCF